MWLFKKKNRSIHESTIIIDSWTEKDVTDTFENVLLEQQNELKEIRISVSDIKNTLDKLFRRYDYERQKIVIVFSSKRIKKIITDYLSVLSRKSSNFNEIIYDEFLKSCLLTNDQYEKIKNKINKTTTAVLIEDADEWIPTEKYIVEDANHIESCKVINLNVKNSKIILEFIKKHKLNPEDFYVVCKNNRILEKITKLLDTHFDVTAKQRIISLIGYQNIDDIPIKKEKVIFYIKG